MYAIVATGGKQIKVTEGSVFRAEKIDAEAGAKVELDVKFVADGDTALMDAAHLKKAKVVCRVVDQGRRKKIRVFKMKKRKNYRRTYGHRQPYTELRVESIKVK